VRIRARHTGDQPWMAILISALLGAVPLPSRVLAFGDSLTAGLVGGTRDQFVPYGAALAAQIGGVDVVSRGVVMESVHTMPGRLQTTLAEAEDRYDCVLLLGGSNDLWKGDAGAIWTSLCELYAQADACGASSLGLFTLPPFEPDVMKWLRFTGILELTESTRRDVNQRIRDESARRANAFLVDCAALADEQPDAFARPDGLHFVASGYNALGDAAADALCCFCEDAAAPTSET